VLCRCTCTRTVLCSALCFVYCTYVQVIDPHKRDPHEEVEILMRYEHPNIVKLRDVCAHIARSDWLMLRDVLTSFGHMRCYVIKLLQTSDIFALLLTQTVPLPVASDSLLYDLHMMSMSMSI